MCVLNCEDIFAKMAWSSLEIQPDISRCQAGFVKTTGKAGVYMTNKMVTFVL